jgi:hypothetical protein
VKTSWRVPYGGQSRQSSWEPRLRKILFARRTCRNASWPDTETGRVVWEYKANLFKATLLPYRWASWAPDPKPGNYFTGERR